MEFNLIDLRLLKAGDEQAWADAFGHLWPIALGVALGHQLTREDAEDVAIETLAAVAEKVEYLAKVEELKALTVAIARRRAISKIRKKLAAKRGGPSGLVSMPPDQMAEAEQSVAPTSHLSEQELSELILLLHKLLETLDANTRSLLIEKVAEGCTFEELSRKHGVSLGTLCSKLARALEKVRKSLGNSPLLLKELKEFLR